MMINGFSRKNISRTCSWDTWTWHIVWYLENILLYYVQRLRLCRRWILYRVRVSGNVKITFGVIQPCVGSCGHVWTEFPQPLRYFEIASRRNFRVGLYSQNTLNIRRVLPHMVHIRLGIQITKGKVCRKWRIMHTSVAVICTPPSRKGGGARHFWWSKIFFKENWLHPHWVPLTYDAMDLLGSFPNSTHIKVVKVYYDKFSWLDQLQTTRGSDNAISKRNIHFGPQSPVMVRLANLPTQPSFRHRGQRIS